MLCHFREKNDQFANLPYLFNVKIFLPGNADVQILHVDLFLAIQIVTLSLVPEIRLTILFNSLFKASSVRLSR